MCITYWCGAFRLWRHRTWHNVFNCMPLFLAENMKAFPILQTLRIIGVRLTKIDETLSVGKFFMLERLYGCTKIREPWAVCSKESAKKICPLKWRTLFKKWILSESGFFSFRTSYLSSLYRREFKTLSWRLTVKQRPEKKNMGTRNWRRRKPRFQPREKTFRRHR